jgi:Polysaccharide lyase
MKERSMNKLFFSVLVLGLTVILGCSKNMVGPNEGVTDSKSNVAVGQTSTSFSQMQTGPLLSVVTPGITFETAKFDASYNLLEDGNTYAFISKGTLNTNYKIPVLTTSQHYAGSKCIQYQMPRTTVSGSITNDKSQHRIESGGLNFDEKRYYGFALKLDASMEQPTSACQIFQIWQGTPMSPALEVDLMPGGSGNTFNFRVWVRNNNTKANPSAGILVYSGSIQRGSWNTFVLMVIMRSVDEGTNGEAKLWLNGTQMFDWFGNAGYDDGIEYAGVQYTPNDAFDTFFGPYRACQQAIVNMYYDNVKNTTTYSEAIP